MKRLEIDLDDPSMQAHGQGIWFSCGKPRLERHPGGAVQLVIDMQSNAAADMFAEYMGVKILCSPCADVAARMDRLEAQLRGKVL